ncbi:MAG: glycosyl transferase [Rhodobacteraceae bacterium]|nr:glycosyl transferase [Paracoccaceae bacterium]
MLFCFDDRIRLGAGVTMLSLLDAAAEDTVYHVHVFHPGLPDPVRAGIESLYTGTRHNVIFHEIRPDRFDGAPRNSGSWTEIVYFRLLASEVLADLDRVIYCDVDVFFLKDMQPYWALDLDGHDWAGVAAEGNSPDNLTHKYFPENTNDAIFNSAFMVMNLPRLRAQGAVQRYFDVIEQVGDRLKFFDLDVVNIASDSILRLPFDTMVLEDIYELDDVTQSRDWAYLQSVYSVADLEAARDDPAIIHFAGRRGKPWQRQAVPAYYREVQARLPGVLQKTTFRDWRKKWIGAKGRRRYPMRSAL